MPAQVQKSSGPSGQWACITCRGRRAARVHLLIVLLQVPGVLWRRGRLL